MEEENVLEWKELLRRRKYAIYQKKPLKWVEDILEEPPKFYKWSLHEGYENHVWDGDKDPVFTAWTALANEQWASLTAATGTAKTFSAARIALWFLDVFEDSLIVTCAPKEDQLKLNLWAEISKILHKFKKVRPNLVLTKLNLKAEGTNDDSPFQNTHQVVGFVAGVGADEESANKARGFHRKNMLFILEETTGIDAAIITAFKNTCTGSNNLILALGNPNSEQDQLYKFSSLANVVSCRISGYDHPNVVLGKEIYAGAVSQKSIDRRAAEYPDGVENPMFKAMVRGITAKNDANSIIKSDWLEFSNKKSEKFKSYKEESESYNGCGVDAAQSEGRDKASISWFKGNTLVRLDEFQCNNATHLAYNLIFSNDYLIENNYNIYPTGKLEDYDIMSGCIAVDAVGLGVATINAFMDEGYNDIISVQGGAWTDEGIIPIETLEDGRSRPKYKFSNLRTQLYWEAARDIESGSLIINLENDLDGKIFERLSKELTAIRYAQSDNAIAVEKKESIKKRLGGKSPNLADAFVYGNWARKGYRIMSTDMPFSFG